MAVNNEEIDVAAFDEAFANALKYTVPEDELPDGSELVFDGSAYWPSYRAALSVTLDQRYKDGSVDLQEAVDEAWSSAIAHLESTLPGHLFVEETDGMVFVTALTNDQ